MQQFYTLKTLFKRYRRPGDIVFAWFALAVSVFLLSQITDQVQFKQGGKFGSQPQFWPMVSLGLMTLFAAFHVVGSAVSERITGRWQEVGKWLSSIEYAVWFVVYAALVPKLGYLPSTLLFALLLALRAGYRSKRVLASIALAGFATVVLFKTLLQVKLPAGQIYEYLPDGLRLFMLAYF